MDLDKECLQKTEEMSLKEEEQKVATNFLLKKNKKSETRLKKQKDFNFVFSKGKRIYSNTLTLLFIEKESLKIGISLSKKHGKAVVRNRIKRLIRANLVKYKNKFNSNYYIIILPKVCENYDFKTYKKDLEYLFKKGNLLND